MNTRESEVANLVRDAVQWLENNQVCSKHHVEHTGKQAYALDFYDYLEEIDKGKEHLWHLLSKIITSPEGLKVFFPGHLDPRNMSQNVIDAGAAVDAIARFASKRADHFSLEEHKKIKSALQEVVDTYLISASANKAVTNRRLWGLTGLASFAQYVGNEGQFDQIVHKSIEQAFNDMTVDGFFLYNPDPGPKRESYNNSTTYYQSRHTAFIQYVLEILNIDPAPYEEKLEQSIKALLSMYLTNGTKDMRMECKRWYWLSPYEVASNSFDSYALTHSKLPEAETALHNALYQIKQHFSDKHIHSHKGADHNFQCPIFWTAHLAWMIRIPNIEEKFAAATTLKPFSFRLTGKEVFTDTNNERRILINTLLGPRNANTGIGNNGLPHKWSFGGFPSMPYAYLVSAREMLNHTKSAIRGRYFGEAIHRVWHFTKETFVAFLPLYSTNYGHIDSFEIDSDHISICVQPASKYGTSKKEKVVQKISL